MSSLRLTSPSFESGGSVPAKHTSDGADVSPALAWSGVPGGTRSLALVVDDPDAPDPRAPRMTWVHWVLYDIPPEPSSLPEGVDSAAIGAREGINDWHATGYRGPAPPIGRHRYVHTLYALDAVLPDLGRADKKALERAMRGHVLAEATLVGTYAKHGRH
jgi:Raf kinase inhibitor-like YbhB/YbcL family protein